MTKDVKPTALLVRSGDAMVLAGPSRRFYHGVPRVLIENGPSEAFELKSYGASEGEDMSIAKFLSERRINLSMRESL